MGIDVNTYPPPQAPNNGAQLLVRDGFTTAQGYASESLTKALSFLDGLQSAVAPLLALPPVDVTLPPVSAIVTPFAMPAAPARPTDIALNTPAAPADPTLGAVVPLSLPNAPEFTVAAPVIDLNIAPPVALTTTVPSAPDLLPVTIPDAPDLVLPGAPDLLAITVPAAPLLNLPVFTAVQPDSPLAPAYIFSFAELAYTSELLTDLRSVLLEWVNGAATGLPADVESAIWERDRQREVVASRRKIAEVTRNFARSGFTKPPGAMSVEIASALQDSQNTIAAASREVMIKQADLEQSNRRFAFEQAWKVEEGLIQYNSAIAQRSFEAAKFAQQVGIDIYRETVAKFRAEIEAYAAKVEAFKAALQAELAQLEIYKSEIEAQRLISTINQQAVETYTARVGALRTLIDLFAARVSASNAIATVNKTTIEGFAATVGAYAETVRAKAAEYEAYATRVKAEVSKAEVFTAQVNAYSGQVGGFKATVEALTAAKTSEIEVKQRLPLDVFKARTDVFRTLVGAESERVGAVTRTYTADADVFKSKIQGESARVGSEVDIYKADTDVSKAVADLRIESARVTMQTLAQQIGVLVEAIKGGAQVAAQLAAASLSSVNLSAQIGDHTSYGVSNSVSNSAQVSGVNSYSESHGFNTSTLTQYNYTP